MRQFLAFIMVFICLISLVGCKSSEDTEDNSVIFYYRRAEYTYNSDENVVMAEKRELNNDRYELSYLLSLYMLGPTDERLISPFPSQTTLQEIVYEENAIAVTLSDFDSAISDSHFTIAAACLAMTIFELTEYETVTVNSGQHSITLDKTNTLFHDGISPSGQ